MKIFVPRVNDMLKNLNVIVNGKTYPVAVGKENDVPYEVAMMLFRSQFIPNKPEQPEFEQTRLF